MQKWPLRLVKMWSHSNVCHLIPLPSLLEAFIRDRDIYYLFIQVNKIHFTFEFHLFPLHMGEGVCALAGVHAEEQEQSRIATQ